MAKPFCALLVPPSGHLMVRAIAEAVFFCISWRIPSEGAHSELQTSWDPSNTRGLSSKRVHPPSHTLWQCLRRHQLPWQRAVTNVSGSQRTCRTPQCHRKARTERTLQVNTDGPRRPGTGRHTEPSELFTRLNVVRRPMQKRQKGEPSLPSYVLYLEWAS